MSGSCGVYVRVRRGGGIMLSVGLASISIECTWFADNEAPTERCLSDHKRTQSSFVKSVHYNPNRARTGVGQLKVCTAPSDPSMTRS